MMATTRALAVTGSQFDPPGAEAFVREWIDPAYLRLVQFLSIPAAPGQPAEGLLVLAHLCRRAIQPDLFPDAPMPRMARLTFRGIVGLCVSSAEKHYGPWPCSRETTLKWLILLEAVTVIYRFRSKGETVVLLPLGSRPTLDLSRLVLQIEAYEKKYSNKKTRALLRRSRERLTLCSAALAEAMETEQVLDRLPPLELQRQFLSQLAQERLAPSRCAHIAHWFTLGSAAAPISSQHLSEESALAHVGSSRDTTIAAPAGRIHHEAGDSTGSAVAVLTTSARKAGDSTRAESPGQVGIAHLQVANALGDSDAQGRREAHRDAGEAGDSAVTGDSRRQSNLESLSILVITHRGSRFDCEEALLAEAERYVRLLDGPLPPKSKWTKGVLNGYRNCIEQDPLLACVSLINTLLRLHCPLQGKEDQLRIPRKWFHTSYKKYADALDPMPLTDDIRSFVESPYSYEEMAQALAAWFDLNHASLWRRPCAADLVGAGLLEEVVVAAGADEEELPPYPAADAPWGVETCLALLDYYRGQPLPPELHERATQAVAALVGGGEGEMRWSRFDRYEVESVLIAWLEEDPEVRTLLPAAGNGDDFPDVWSIVEAMEGAWAIVRQRLLATGQFVELDDGTLISCDEYTALYERTVNARDEEKQRDVYEHSLSYYLRLLQEEESAYKDAPDHPPAQDLEVSGSAPAELAQGEDAAEWSDPIGALEWAQPLRRALPFDLYGLEIRMTRQWHCVLVVWALQDPENDTLTLYNSAQVVQLIEGLQASAQEQAGALAVGEGGSAAAMPAAYGAAEREPGRAAPPGEESHHQHTEWGPSG